MSKKQYMVIFQPSARRGFVDEGTNLIEASRQLGVDIEALCGEKKVCGKCKVRIEEGFYEKFAITSSRSHASEWQEEEDKFFTPAQKDEGYRLACVAKVQGDMLVFVPEEARAGKQVVSKAARDIHIDWNPAVKQYHVQVVPPTFEEPAGDFERICAELERNYGLKDLNIDWPTLRKLPRRQRDGNWGVTVAVWMDKEIVRVLPGKVEDSYGIAIDVGTTTVAAYLCNLRTMEVIKTVSMMNPQCKYGEDVMARITYHMMNPGGLETMSNDLIEGLNKLVVEACESTHPPKKRKKKKAEEADEIIEAPDVTEHAEELDESKYLNLIPADIVDMTIVCNTAMHHILLKLDPEFVGLAPFPPVIHRSLDIRARDLGIKINDSAYVHVLPNEAGFVGADNVGVLIAEEPYKFDQTQLLIDIGTNGELVLGNNRKLISCSCATGPALEGAQLSFGMRAAPGAIERIHIDPETHDVDYKVIGRDAWRKYSKPEDMKTKGICGSGILDVLAELYASGVIMKSGRFSKKQKSNRYRVNPDTKQPEFVIAWANETSIGKDVVISQKDIRQIQLGKGALYTGCKLMMRRLGLDKVDSIKIAGAFGTHVDKTKALIMGLFPDCDLEKVFAVGNAAGDGARAALLNREKRAEANWVSRNVEYIELTVESDFQQQFMEAMQLPHMKDEFPHLEGVVAPEVLHQK
ncbi:ASKHA domain-containing protein [Desulfomonile tiedjei]|uniref:Putative metal-binding protein n=1 Tax=Desulfomonile tiedjei (strain ATCC 49306 / DSM 6799 / DCB-1) TaxID=706587 RepID=I4C204_DESTA|nr:ASKHA domain-containing protein [Desulfomonile tiedjei]AFM23595.1 putative metal-binding protein [Desulfomonile tiedjei DSM 6799]